MRLLITSIILMLYTVKAFAGSESHGGDSIKITFAKARYLAIEMVKAFQPIPGLLNGEVSSWITAHREELIDDLKSTPPYNWVDRQLGHDAMTSLTRNSQISFSLPTMRSSSFDKTRAAELIIHETVHHLGETNEILADAVAAALSNSFEVRYPSASISLATWQPIEAPPGLSSDPTLSYSFVAADNLVNGKAFILKSNGTTHFFDPASHIWTEGASIPKIFPELGREKFSLTSNGQAVLAFGLSQNSSHAYYYNAITNTWHQASGKNLPNPGMHPKAIAAGKKFIVFGERLEDSHYTQRINRLLGAIYDPQSDTWEKIEPPVLHKSFLNGKIFWDQTGLDSGRLFVCFSGDFSYTSQNGIIYDLRRKEWSSIPAINVRVGDYNLDGNILASTWTDHGLLALFSIRGSEKNSVWVGLYNSDKGTWDTHIWDRYAPTFDSESDFVYSNGKKVFVFKGGRNSLPLYSFDLTTRKWQIKNLFKDEFQIRTFSSNLWTGESLIQFGGKTSNSGAESEDHTKLSFGSMIDP